MSAPTPGPWDYERSVDPRDVERPWIGRLAENRYAALACGESADEAWANARLIAAAPELYEALDELIELVRPNVYPQPDKPDSPYAKLERARLALAKARGEQ